MDRYRVTLAERIESSGKSKLTLNWPGMRWPVETLQEQLLWWPDGVPVNYSARLAFVSSHLGKFPEQHQEWIMAISQVIQKLPTSTLVVCSTRNLLGELVLEACRLHNHPVAYMGDLVKSNSSESPIEYRLQLTKPVCCELPEADVETVAIADTLIVGPIRKRGKVEEVLERFGIGKRLQFASLRTATRTNDRRSSATTQRTNREEEKVTINKTVGLIHWTRACAGPWPMQSRQQWLRSLIKNQGDHSAFTTLCRIARMRMLLPSGKGISGQVPCVCFTATPLEQFAARRVYRPHRCRWDFEPYGLVLPWSLLREFQPARVVYVRGRTSARAKAMMQPYLQPFDASGIDWTQEDEWRIARPVPLHDHYDHEIQVFVATQDEAKRIGNLVPWQTIVLG